MEENMNLVLGTIGTLLRPEVSAIVGSTAVIVASASSLLRDEKIATVFSSAIASLGMLVAAACYGNTFYTLTS